MLREKIVTRRRKAVLKTKFFFEKSSGIFLIICKKKITNKGLFKKTTILDYKDGVCLEKKSVFLDVHHAYNTCYSPVEKNENIDKRMMIMMVIMFLICFASILFCHVSLA